MKILLKLRPSVLIVEDDEVVLLGASGRIQNSRALCWFQFNGVWSPTFRVRQENGRGNAPLESASMCLVSLNVYEWIMNNFLHGTTGSQVCVHFGDGDECDRRRYSSTVAANRLGVSVRLGGTAGTRSILLRQLRLLLTKGQGRYLPVIVGPNGLAAKGAVPEPKVRWPMCVDLGPDFGLVHLELQCSADCLGHLSRSELFFIRVDDQTDLVLPQEDEPHPVDIERLAMASPTAVSFERRLATLVDGLGCLLRSNSLGNPTICSNHAVIYCWEPGNSADLPARVAAGLRWSQTCSPARIVWASCCNSVVARDRIVQQLTEIHQQYAKHQLGDGEGSGPRLGSRTRSDPSISLSPSQQPPVVLVLRDFDQLTQQYNQLACLKFIRSTVHLVSGHLVKTRTPLVVIACSRGLSFSSIQRHVVEGSGDALRIFPLLCPPLTEVERLNLLRNEFTWRSDDELNRLVSDSGGDDSAALLIKATARVAGAATSINQGLSVGGYNSVKQILEDQVVWPWKHQSVLGRLLAPGAIRPPGGLLLYGPPGCGKSLLARWTARAVGGKLICVQAVDLLSRYFGETERNIRQMFDRARQAAPSVLLCDDLETLMESRDGSTASSGGGHTGRFVGALLAELDGVRQSLGSQGVFVIGTTSRRDLIDQALLRPGRLDRSVMIGLPTCADRQAILESLVRARSPSLDSVDVGAVATRTTGYTGKQLAFLCDAAALHAIDRAPGVTVTAVHNEDFEAILETKRVHFS